MDEAKIWFALKCCIGLDGRYGCHNCPYDKSASGGRRVYSECKPLLYADIENLYSDMKNVIKLLEADEA